MHEQAAAFPSLLPSVGSRRATGRGNAQSSAPPAALSSRRLAMLQQFNQWPALPGFNPCTQACSDSPVERGTLSELCRDPQALERIAKFLLALILWIWLKNTERLAGWPSIWESVR